MISTVTGSLRRRLVAVAAALVILFVAAGAYIVRDLGTMARAQSERQLLETTRALSLVVDAEYARYETLLRGLAASPDLARRDWGSVDRIARAATPAQVEWVIVSDRAGRQLVNTRLPAGAALPGAPWQAARLAAFDSGRLHVCPLSRGLVVRRVLCLDLPVMRDGRAEHIVSVVFEPKSLQRIIDAQRVPASRYATVIDRDFIVAWRNVSPDRYVGVSATPDMVAALRSSQEGVQDSLSLNGVPTVIAHARGRYGLSFMVAIPRTEMNAAQLLSARSGLVVSALLLLLALAAAFLFGRHLSTAIQRLAAAARAFKAGEAPAFQPTRIPEVDGVGRVLGEAYDLRREADDRFALAQEVGEVGAWDWDIAADLGEVTHGYLRIHGLPPQAGPLRLKQVFAVVHRDDRERYLAGLADDVAGDGPVAGEYRVVHPDGSVHWIALKGRIIRDAAGAPLRSVGVVQDVTARRAVEAALAESESRLRLATEGIGVGIYDLDLGAGRGVWSDLAFAVLGLEPPADRIGTFDMWQAAIHPDDREALFAEHERHRAARSAWTTEYRVVRANTGETRWLEAHGRFAALPGGGVRSIGIVADITGRKETELSLRESESRLRRSQEAGSIGSYEWDMVTGLGAQSEAMLRMVGLAPGRTYALKEIVAPILKEDLPQVLATVGRINSGATRLETNYRIRHPQDGGVRWIRDIGQVERDAAGRPRRWVGIIQDVTERTEAELALREEERRFRTLANTVPAFVWFASPDGRLRYLNDRWRAYTGTEPGGELPPVWGAGIHPDDAPAVQAQWSQAAASGAGFEIECRYRRHDGAWRWYIARAEPVRDAAGAVTDWFGTSTDIHARRAAESALKAINESLNAEVAERTEQLRQSQKLESMGQLTGGVAHDFNNLLTPIIGSLDLLQRRGLGGEREQRMIEGALQSAERAKTLVQRLLAFARRQPLQLVPVDLSATVADMADLIASTSGPKVKLSLDLEPGLPPVVADKNQLELALLNLAVNARDAMPDGGRISIAAVVDRVPASHRSGLAPGRFVRLAVSDSGVGMDAETLARAVEPFFSTKGIGKGTGLGLSMVHGVANQLGGALHIDSKPGLGTTVEIWLPISGRAPSRADPQPAVEGPAARTVLLVDDDQLARASTAEMLSDLGYAVAEAESAEDALRLLERGIAFDVLVTDHLMPGLSGTDLARRVRDRAPCQPVLIISGYADVEGIAPDFQRLVKPFRQAELSAALAALRQEAGVAAPPTEAPRR